MTRNLKRIILLLLWLSCRSLSSQVHQVPSSIIRSPQALTTISCNHSISSYYVILWYQRPIGDSALKLIGYIQYTNPVLEDTFKQHFNVTGDGSRDSQLHVLKPRQPEDSGVYYCAASTHTGSEAHFGKGTKLTVLEDGHNITSPKVEVLKPSKYECRNKKDENRKKTIVCVASGFYPDHVSVFWQLNEEKVTKGVATDNAALRDGETYKITSRLRVSAEDWFKPDNKFKCIVSFYNGTSEVNYEKPVNGEKAENTGSTMTKEQYLKVTHAGKLSYVVFIIKSCIYGVFVGFLVWKLQGSAGKANI